MKTFRVALAQIAPALGDLERNLELHEQAAARAVGEQASVLVFPELSLTGYLLRDQVPEVAAPVDGSVVERLARASRKVDLVVGWVEQGEGYRFFNAAAYFARGELLHLHRKLFLPNYGMFQEARDLAAGERLRGFDSPWGPAGMLICEDLWHPTCAWLLAQEGAELLYALSSSPTRGARPGDEVTSVTVWRRLLRVTAQFQTAWVIYVNRVGCEDGLTYGGGSMVVDPFGRVVAEIPALEEGLLTVELDAEVLRRARTAYPLLRDERLDLVSRELERIRGDRYEIPPREQDDNVPRRPAESRPGVAPRKEPRS